MIPKKMEHYLRDHLPQAAIENRLIREDRMCFLEFGPTDELLLARLGITVDKLGPRLVACIWDEASDLEIGGYLVVDNLSMGSPSMGGIRKLPDITPLDIHNLARGMTLKNAAAHLPYGGGKSGIVAEREMAPQTHRALVAGFARLIRRYRELYVPGPDVGTNDQDMKTIAIVNGLDSAVSKPYEMGGNRIDELGAAAGGVVGALLTLLEIMPRLRVLPQFSNLEIPAAENLTVLIQGFGAVGAHAARILKQRLPQAKTIGISDLEGYLYDESGLPVEALFNLWKTHRVVTHRYYTDQIAPQGYACSTKFSTEANNLLRESAFCLIPAAAVFKYLGVLASEKASMKVNSMGDWSVIIEGANTYSSDPNEKAARKRMEQIVFRQKGVMIANDYLVNSGGVIFAAQEYRIKTPEHLQIPSKMLGKRKAVEGWLKAHAGEFAALSEKRLEAGEIDREKAIRHNMIELVDLLAADADLLPCGGAECISVQRLTAKERARTAKDIMIPMKTIDINSSVQAAAALITDGFNNIISVLSPQGKLAGVVTSWDVTHAVSKGVSEELSLEKIMTRDVVYASPADSILDIVRELEQNQISAMPVVEDGKVLGMINSDLLAHRYLLPYLESQAGG
ncbi:MAG: Glu/Leu/Phe/Val dehydrogenase dimerization domain-containing protein [Desulfobacterales bacterium]|jgi:glutamate dehydrogenase/leucine dehydrogenase